MVIVADVPAVSESSKFQAQYFVQALCERRAQASHVRIIKGFDVVCVEAGHIEGIEV